jgi:GPI-anchor transamidase subunit U
MIPMSICLRRRPVLLFWVLFTYITMLKPYPSVADLAVEFGLLPLFYQLVFEFIPRFFVIVQMFLYSFVLMPLAWNAWLYQGSGNANFYYASTLVVGIAQIWLLIEILHLALERAYQFKHKLHPYAKSQKTE